jgi:hypothetical protein
MAASAVALAAFFVFSSMSRMKPELMTDAEMERLFQQSSRISEAEFDELYDVVAAYLKTQGTFGESGLDDDFSGSRWIDPISTLTLVSNVPITLSLAEGLRDELQKLHQHCAVLFDGVDGRSYASSGGRFIREK